MTTMPHTETAPSIPALGIRPPLWKLALGFVVGWLALFEASAVFEALPGASVWFLPAGWTVAFVYVFGRRAWPLTALGPLAVGWMAYDTPVAALLDVLQDLRHAVAYGGAGLLLRTLPDISLPPRKVRHLGWFWVLVGTASVLSAVLAAEILTWGAGGAFEVMLAFGIGDGGGAIVLAPALVALLRRLVVGDLSIAPRSAWRAVGNLLGIAAVVWIAYGLPAMLHSEVELGYLILLPLAWIATHGGAVGMALGVLTANFLILAVARLHGVEIALLDHQVLMLAATVTGQLVAAATAERDDAMAEVRRQRAALSDEVAARTHELAEANLALLHENQERRRAEEEAYRAARLKTEMVANLSHEIRTPMHGILGLARLLERGMLPPAEQRHLHLLQRSAHGLLRLLNDILDFSKIEAEMMVLEEVVFAPREMVDVLIGLEKPIAERKGIELHQRVDPAIPRELLGDPSRLRQVLLNLLDNALKFTEQGRVELRLRAVEERDDGIRLRIEVEDSGIGIPPDARKHLFEPFTQADGSTSRRFGGTGLGLTNCRRIVERMGGEIDFESLSGEGSTFWLEIPLRVPTAHGGEPEDCSRVDTSPTAHLSTTAAPNSILQADARRFAARILVVDDEPINRLVVEEEIAVLGYRVKAVESGEEALREVDDAPWDLILMDCQMPGLDGYETTRRIRRLEDERRLARTPILALTAQAMHGDEERCREAGMDGHLAKPFELERLAATLDAHLLTATVDETTAAAEN